MIEDRQKNISSQITLKEIEIENFKGVKHAFYDFKDKSVIISGKNKSGKTTIYEAYLWCLFRKLASGIEDNILPRRETTESIGDVVHKVKAKVFVVLTVNGVEQIFGRTLEEKWTKPRGKQEEILIGTNSEYYFNSKEVPCGLSQFKKHLEEICNVDIWYTCSNIDNFMRMNVNDRRTLLKNVSSCKNDEEIALDYPYVLQSLKNKKTIDEIKKEISVSLTKTKTEYESIPDQKDAQEKLRVNVDIAIIKKNKSTIEQELRELDDILQQNANSELFKMQQAKNEELLKYQTALSCRQNELSNNLINKKQDYEFVIKKIEREIDKIQSEIYLLQNTNEEYRKKITLKKKEISELGGKWEVENSTQILIPEKCDKCGAVLNDVVQQEYLQRAVDEKQKKLKKYERDAEIIRDSISEIEWRLANNDTMITDKELKNTHLKTEIKNKKNELENLPDIVTICANDSECIKLSDLCDKTLKEIESLKENVNIDEKKEREHLKLKRIEKQAMLEECIKQLASIEINKRVDEEQLKLDEKARNLIANMDILENRLKEVNEFKKTRIAYIEDSVSSLFNICQFKMFEKNVTNDGEKDICTPYANGVPIEEQNLATKIAMKIDICNGLMKAIGYNLPLFIDNTESISPLPEFFGQTIALQHIPNQELTIQVIEKS